MSLPQSIGVIMGANVGTTITAQIVALKVTQYALLVVAVGFAFMFFARDDKLRHFGHMILGLGLILFGMQLMSDGTRPLRTYDPFLSALREIDQPLSAIALGAGLTAILQSSSATTGMIIALASNGYISLESGISVVLGSNIGTCITALLASWGKSREAIRAAVVHVIFNVVGVAIWFGAIGQLADFVRFVSPAANEQAVAAAAEELRQQVADVDSLTTVRFSQAARRAAETPRQIANAHTIFNLANLVIMIWFAGPLAWLATKLVPDLLQQPSHIDKPRYLDDLLLQTPAMAMDIVRMELGRLGTAAVRMVRRSLRVVLDGSRDDLLSLARLDADVDRLHAAIVAYLGRLSRKDLSASQATQLRTYLAAANYIESIADVVETNLVETGQARLRNNLKVSPSTRDVLAQFHEQVQINVENAIHGLVEHDRESANHVIAAKPQVTRLAVVAETHLSRRLTANEPNRVAAFRLESDIIEYFKRVYYFSKRIAKLLVEQDTQLSSIQYTQLGTSDRPPLEERLPG